MPPLPFCCGALAEAYKKDMIAANPADKITLSKKKKFYGQSNLYLKGKDTSVFETDELFAIYDSIMLMSIKWREQFKVFSTDHPKSAKIKSKGTWAKKYYALCFSKKKEQRSQVVTDEMCTAAFSELMN